MQQLNTTNYIITVLTTLFIILTKTYTIDMRKNVGLL